MGKARTNNLKRGYSQRVTFKILASAVKEPVLLKASKNAGYTPNKLISNSINSIDGG